MRAFYFVHGFPKTSDADNVKSAFLFVWFSQYLKTRYK